MRLLMRSGTVYCDEQPDKSLNLTEKLGHNQRGQKSSAERFVQTQPLRPRRLPPGRQAAVTNIGISL